MSRVGRRHGVLSPDRVVPTTGPERRQDVLLAGVLACAGLGEVALGVVPGHVVPASLALVVLGAALTVRRTRPRTCLALVLVVLVVQSQVGVPVNAQVMTMPFILVAAYSVGAHIDRRGSATGLVLGAALASGLVAASGSGPSDYGFGLFLVTAPWVAGVLVRARHTAEVEAVTGAQDLARQAAQEERERIARELHDVVSHGLSAMVVQAAAAAELVDRSPGSARQAMLGIQSTGADAMTEMRHMLGLMRGGGAATDRRPQPALEDVEELVSAERVAGRHVTLTVHGAPRQLPRGLGLSVYRVVQESLTNARKHAPAGRCEVIISYGPGSLVVEVVNDRADGSPRPDRPGFGILGMRERARLYDGTLEAGPRPDGGWRVLARFPLEHDPGACS